MTKKDLGAILAGSASFACGMFAYLLLMSFILSPMISSDFHRFLFGLASLLLTALLCFRAGYITAFTAKTQNMANPILVGIICSVVVLSQAHRLSAWLLLIPALFIPLSFKGYNVYLKSSRSNQAVHQTGHPPSATKAPAGDR